MVEHLAHCGVVTCKRRQLTLRPGQPEVPGTANS